MMLFGANPKELIKAFAIYGAAAPAGGTAGVFLGGVITEWVAWPWVFYINIPIALVVLAVIPGLMPSVPARRGSIDLVGEALLQAQGAERDGDERVAVQEPGDSRAVARSLGPEEAQQCS